MPTTHRRYKITRKELKQPDEFTSFIETAQEFFVTNLRQMIISAVVVISAAAIFGATYWYERREDRLAGNQFYSALNALTAKQYKSAEDQFSKLAAAQPHRRVGKLAQFYLGCAYLQANDLAHARDAFVAFLADEHDRTFANLALTNLGVIYERMGEYAKAAGAYQQAASVGGPEEVRAQLGMARMMAKQGHNDAAVALYRAFLAAHPFAPQRQEVVESLAMLGASPLAAPPSGNMPVVIPNASATKSAH
jgi:predicted negative regulator of RcsB-dependent stress response